MLPPGAPDPSAPHPSAPHSADFALQPSYLHRHVQLGSNQDDTTVPLDTSQVQDLTSSSCSPTTLAHLPAELLLHIVEYVPVGYVLDWRLVCRSFRDAIDGRVLYQYLRRTRLLGYLGSRESIPKLLHADQYEQIHMLEARFLQVESAPGESEEEVKRNSAWTRSYAIFRLGDEWYRAFHRIGGAEKRQGHTIVDADACWFSLLNRLEIKRLERRWGTLRWCIALDHAVLDLDFPVEIGGMHFDLDINLESRHIRVAWKDMLFSFLKTERALRLLLDEKYTDSTFTFRHTEEDCLRAVRRARLCASLNLSKKWCRRLERSLRLPPRHYGLPRPFPLYDDPDSDIENDAIQQLLFLRRSALFSPKQLSYLHSLASDYREMKLELNLLDCAYRIFRGYSSSSSYDRAYEILNTWTKVQNPLKWSDKLRDKIEGVVLKWRAQKNVIQQVTSQLRAATGLVLKLDDDDDDDEEGNE